MDRLLKKYLKNKAKLAPIENQSTDKWYSAVVVIPVLAELNNIPKTLASLSRVDGEFGILLVINNRADEQAQRIRKNQELLENLRAGNFNHINDLMWIDCSSETKELAPDRGVGLARRIGMDSALPLLKENGLLFSLDADCFVEANYLNAAKDTLTEPIDAGCFHFKHQKAQSPETQAGIEAYENYLTHYVDALNMANSPYAFPAIGSIIAVTAKAYILADGMPLKRQAAEDFYFLQNVAKHCPIKTMPSTVYPSARLSSRTPFGTGQQMIEFTTNQASKDCFSNQAFIELKQLLEEIIDHIDQAKLKLTDLEISNYSRQTLDEIGFTSFWEKLQLNYQTTPQKLTAFHRWFDALKTLKYIKGFKHDEKN